MQIDVGVKVNDAGHTLIVHRAFARLNNFWSRNDVIGDIHEYWKPDDFAKVATNPLDGQLRVAHTVIGAGVAPGNTHFLRGDQVWATLPKQYIAFDRAGTLPTPFTSIFHWSPDENVAMFKAKARLLTPPQSANATFDLLRNGTSLFGASKLTIVANQNAGSIVFPGTALVAKDDDVTFKLLTTGTSPNQGVDLSIQFSYIPIPDAIP